MDEKEKNIELIKLKFDLLKHHIDVVIKGFILYFAVISGLFGLIAQTENQSIVLIFYLTIIVASLFMIFLSLYLKKYSYTLQKNIIDHEKILDTNLKDLLGPTKSIFISLIIVGLIVTVTSVILLIIF